MGDIFSIFYYNGRDAFWSFPFIYLFPFFFYFRWGTVNILTITHWKNIFKNEKENIDKNKLYRIETKYTC